MIVPIVLGSIIALLTIALMVVHFVQYWPRRPQHGGSKKRRRKGGMLELLDPSVGQDLTFPGQQQGGFMDGGWANMADIGGGDAGNGF